MADDQRWNEDLIRKLKRDYDCGFEVQPMEMKLKELKVRIGRPYVYVHDVNCEHLLIVRDVFGRRRRKSSSEREGLLGEKEEEEQGVVCVWKKKKRIYTCSVCKALKAVKVVLRDRTAAQSPAWFCKDCYVKAHYSASGELLPYFNSMLVFDID